VAPAPTTLRMPEELRDEVAGLARRERRSFSAQVLTLVEDGLRARGRLPRHEQELLDEMRDELGAREVER
jgi:hypothetical protein